MLAVLAVGIGVGIALLAGGSLQGLGNLRLRHEWAVLPLFLIQGFSRGRFTSMSATSFGTAAWILSSAVLLALLAADWRLPGMWAATIGIGLNLLVVLLNSGMPVVLGSASAVVAVRAGAAVSAGFYRVLSQPIAPALADALPISFFGGRYFASVGDLCLVVGVAVVVFAATLAGTTGRQSG